MNDPLRCDFCGIIDSPTTPVVQDRAMVTTPSAPVLTLAPGAPKGGKEGCYGYLVLDITRNDCGSWSKPCSVDLSLYCEADGCWWSRLVEGPITAETFRVAMQQHGADTCWPSDAPQVEATYASVTEAATNAHSGQS